MISLVIKPLVTLTLLPSVIFATSPIPVLIPEVKVEKIDSFHVILPQNYYPSSEYSPITVLRDTYIVTPPPVIVAPEPVIVAEPETLPEPVTEASIVEEPAIEEAVSPSFHSPSQYGDVVSYAMQFVGVVPYGWGASPDDSFGCDGLTQYVFGQFGVNLPRGADSQAAQGYEISASEAMAGDLVWYPNTHIGIYAGGGMMIDAPDFGRFVEYRAVWGDPIYIHLT